MRHHRSLMPDIKTNSLKTKSLLSTSRSDCTKSRGVRTQAEMLWSVWVWSVLIYTSSISISVIRFLPFNFMTLVTVWRSVEEDRPLRGKGSQKSHKQSVSLTYTASLVLLKASVTPQSRVVEPDERTTLEMLNKQRAVITEKDPRKNWGEPLVEIKKFKEQTNLEMLSMGTLYANVSTDWMQLKL